MPGIATVRLKDHIYLLKGARRYAFYNTSIGFAAGLNQNEAELIKSLAGGVDPLATGGLALWPAIKRLRNLGALEAGRPYKKIIDLEEHFKSGQKCTLAPGITQIWIELTGLHSLSIKQSGDGLKSGPEKKELGFKQWQAILDPLLRSGLQRVTLIGGDPAAHLPLIKKLTGHIQKTSPRVSISIFSNSTKNLDEEFLRFICGHKITLNASPYNIHPVIGERFIGPQKNLTNNTRALRSQKTNTFAGFIEHSQDTGSKEKIKEFIQKLNITSFDIYPASKVKLSAPKASFEKNTLPSKIHFNPESLNSKTVFHNCFGNSIAINSQGEVFPCIMMRDPSYGNALDENVHEILINKNFSMFARLTKDKVEGCQSCEFRYACFDCRPDAASGENIYQKNDCGYRPDEEL